MLERAQRRATRSEKVSASVKCSGCGYDLIGISLGGVCPECGRPVQKTVRPGPRRSLQSLPVVQQRWLSGACFAAGLGILPLVFLLPLFSVVAGRLSTEAHAVMVALVGVATLAWAGGVFVLSFTLPGEEPANQILDITLPIGLDRVAQISQACWTPVIALLACAPITPATSAREVNAIGFAFAAAAAAGLVVVGVRVLRLSDTLYDEELNNRVLWATWIMTPAALIVIGFGAAFGCYPKNLGWISLTWWLAYCALFVVSAALALALVDLGRTLFWAEINAGIDEDRAERRARRKEREEREHMRPLDDLDRSPPAHEAPRANLTALDDGPIPLAPPPDLRPPHAQRPPTKPTRPNP